MAFNLRAGNRDQLFLMPPSLEDWLSHDHLARTVADVVGQFDLSGFYAGLRADGRGGASYDPASLLSVVLYGYCLGVRSSRKLEKHCSDDIAFRYLCANQVPDHATLARFVVKNEVHLGELFSQMLHLCSRAGLVDATTLALDGTKLMANASSDRNKNIDDIARQVVREAIETDEDEDACFGEKRGDEVPEQLRDPEWIRKALADIKSEQEQSKENKADRVLAEPKVNLTDPDSRVMRTRNGKRNAYNSQAVVSADQVIVAADVTQQSPDNNQLAPMAELAAKNLIEIKKSDSSTLLCDTGYWQPKAIADLPFDDVLINIPPATAQSLSSALTDLDAIKDIFEKALAKEIKQTSAASQLGVTRAVFRRMFDIYKNAPDAALVAFRMRDRLENPDNKTLLTRRKVIVEPVFGQIKHNRDISRYLRRGLAAVTAEWKLICTTHNLLKFWRLTAPEPKPQLA